jgi:hypothetical protein
MHGTGGAPPFHAMQTGGRHLQRRKQRVQVVDAASADQRQRTIKAPFHPLQQGLEVIAGTGIQRRVGELDQGAVDIQEQTPGVRWAKIGSSHHVPAT